MGLTAGIVGLPNVGKSTLFNAITESTALAANYPFATIEPNVGTVLVPDARIDVLKSLVHPQKIVPTTFEFTDIAGLVKGASKGEGLGNQFLSHIRAVDAIIHVIRGFEDENVTHVEGSVDPVRDLATIQMELILSDMELVNKRIPRVEKKAALKIDEEAVAEFALLQKVEAALSAEKPVRLLTFNKDENIRLKSFGLLTQKPMIYVLNVSEDQLKKIDAIPFYQQLKTFADSENAELMPISAQLENDLIGFSEEEKAEMLAAYGLGESGLDQLIQKSYNALQLRTFFTAGEQEVRAWTFKNGMTAKECAGRIHSDFERGFIRAETVAYDDFVKATSYAKSKEMGVYRSEGKEYLVKDGDILLIRFNV
jgi:GTP-binding protein YchF